MSSRRRDVVTGRATRQKLGAAVIERIFETLVAERPHRPIYSAAAPGVVVDRVTGRKREFDAVICSGRERVVVEVWDGPADLQLIEALATRVFDIDADRAIIVAKGRSNVTVRSAAS